LFTFSKILFKIVTSFIYSIYVPSTLFPGEKTLKCDKVQDKHIFTAKSGITSFRAKLFASI